MKKITYVSFTYILLLARISWGNDYINSNNYLFDRTVNSVSATATLINSEVEMGIPDNTGSKRAAAWESSRVTLDKPLSYMGKLVSHDSWTDYLFPSGPTLNTVHVDVKEAWKDGWTGKGVNILLIDAYNNTDYDSDIYEIYIHGITTMMITDLIAPGASKYALDFEDRDKETGFPTDKVKNIFGENIISKTSMKVVNLSFGGGQIDIDWKYVLNGSTLLKNLDVSDAVITKTAGNNAVSADNDCFTYSLATDTNISPRLLIVGATTSDGTPSNKTSLAYYSNTAGSDPIIADRFLVANGNTPYDTGDIKVGGHKIEGSEGTSFAAPRVAGYVAILRHKFPNLDASKSASNLLDTARYDTLDCYPSCSPSIYGKGEASLSHALAPMGNLR
jgi:subtilisin family serine protease